MIPLAFFPKVVSAILSLLPFSSLIYTLVMIIVGKYDASQMLQALLLQFFWLLVMVGSSQLIWKRVQSFITIQGGWYEKTSTHASDFYQTIHQANSWSTRSILWLVS